MTTKEQAVEEGAEVAGSMWFEKIRKETPKREWDSHYLPEKACGVDAFKAGFSAASAKYQGEVESWKTSANFYLGLAERLQAQLQSTKPQSGWVDVKEIAERMFTMGRSKMSYSDALKEIGLHEEKEAKLENQTWAKGFQSEAAEILLSKPVIEGEG